MREQTLALLGQGGRALFARVWLPDGEPAGVLVLVHGLAEHSGRYGELVRRLTARRFAVYALDHRGHGRSPGSRANIERFDLLVRDVETLIAQARAAHAAASIFLLGHSMGGAVAFEYALRAPQTLSGLILSGPLLGADPGVSRARVLLARVLSVVLPNVGALTLPASAVSRDPVVVRDYENDPLVFRGAIPARTLAELMAAIASFPERAVGMRRPVLILHGTADQLVPLEHVRQVLERIGSPDKTVKLYEGLYHEVFNEPEKARVFADLEAWLDAHR